MCYSRIENQVVAGVAVAALAAASHAITIYVDDDNCPGPGSGTEDDPYCSIQTAIDNAVDTDEIVVAPGTYFETIDFDGKAVTLRSSDGPDVTTIDGTGFYHVVQCVNGEGPDTTLGGFTTTGGNANGPNWPDRSGGGMFNYNHSSPTVTDCTFSGNSAFQNGGAMYNRNGSSPTVTNCTFSGNTAQVGGGMYNFSNSSPTVINCTFSENEVTSLGSGIGGGMYNYRSSPTVTDCTFNCNLAEGGEWGGGYGGGMYNNESSPMVTNCTFSENTASRGGGGMYNQESSPTVTNCTFSGNTAWDGGGVCHWNYFSPSSPTAINCCTFVDNSAANGRALGFDSDGDPSDLFMANCIVWDGAEGIWNNDSSTIDLTYSDVQGGWPGTGNIDADPMFVDPANGDLRLSPGSPCIDAGHNNAIAGLADTDLDGNPRFADDPATDDTGCGVPVVVDMGAYEYQGDPADVTFGDLDGDGAVRIADLLLLMGCLGSDDPECCTADLDMDGEVGMSDRLLMLGKLIKSIPDP